MEHNEQSTEDKTEPQPKNLNARIEDLVLELEKSTHIIKSRFSYRSSFLRGILQGLGIVIGSTIVAGILYTLATMFINPQIIHDMTIDAVMQKR